jgi:hypothetical protein
MAGADTASKVKVAGDITADLAAPPIAKAAVVMVMLAAADNIRTVAVRDPAQAMRSLRVETVVDNLAAAVVDKVMAAVVVMPVAVAMVMVVVAVVMATAAADTTADTTKPGR